MGEKYQMELFEFKGDDRLQKLRYFFHTQLAQDNWWFPSAKELMEIADRFGVSGNQAFSICKEISQEYVPKK